MPRVRTIAIDLQAGIVVGVVLVPTAMAYGLIAGLGPGPGLYGAIVICLIAAVAGGCRGLISGPNVFVVLVLSPVVAEHGPGAAFTVTMLAGVMLMAAAAAGWGRLIAYVPHSLLSGFFTAAGMVLIVTQVLPAMGLPTAPGGVPGNIAAWVGTSVNFDALAVSGVTIAVGLLWPQRLGRYVPGPFLALVVGVAVGTLWFQSAPAIGEVPRGLPILTVPVFDAALILPAFTIAFLCAAIGLITALQADTLTGGRHRSNYLLGVYGVGNVAAGAVGGTAGGVSVSTFLNIQSGGRTALSAIVAALVMLLTLLALPIDRIPIAVLAGIIIVNGYRIIDWRYLGKVLRVPRGYAAVMLLTAVVGLLADLIAALIVGMVLAALVAARRSEDSELQRLVSVPLVDSAIWPDADSLESHVGLVVMPDWVSVSSAREMSRILGRDIPQNWITVFDFGKVAYMDDTAAALTAQVVAGRRVVFAGLHGLALEAMTAFGDTATLNVVADVDEAKAAIRAGTV